MKTHTDLHDVSIGDRVRFVRDVNVYDEVIPEGTLGTVVGSIGSGGRPYLSKVSHATANGGGFDEHVRLDNGPEVYVRFGGRHSAVERIQR